MNLICYLSNGYPSIEYSSESADLFFEAGCDVLEADFPARDPYLDPPFIQDRMKAALEACGDYQEYMDALLAIKRCHPDKKYIILAYRKTIEEIGEDRFIRFCTDGGFENLVYLGEPNRDFRRTCMDSGLKVSTYIPFHLPEEELINARETNGFLYLQSKSTGEVHPEYDTLDKCIRFLRETVTKGSDRPIYCGVGIRTSDDIRYIKECGADGFFVGSAVLKLRDNPSEMQDFLRQMKAAAI